MNNLIALKILNPTTGLPVKAIAAYLIDKSTTAILKKSNLFILISIAIDYY